MKVFVIHKGSDFEIINSLLDDLKNRNFNFQPLVLENKSKKLWKANAKHLMKKADLVIYFIGEEYSSNIDWEIKIAKALKLPLYFVPLKNEYKERKELYDFDGYEQKPRGTFISLDNIGTILNDDSTLLKEELFNLSNSDPNLMWEQYKIMLETSESLIERRQKISLTYLTIVSIIIPIISSMLVVNNMWVNLMSISLSALSIILCCFWKGIIESYGKTNRAKFKIMELIESNLPVNLFKSEWLALKFHGKRYISFTERETSIPKFFIIVNIIFIIISIVIFSLKLTNVF